MSTPETFTAKLRSDKRKNPTLRTYRRLTFAECKALSGHALYVDWYGDIAQVKITTVKTWKTRPEIEVHCKFGMYEYFQDTIRPDDTDRINFVIEVNE